jgi:hypothetical protein
MRKLIVDAWATLDGVAQAPGEPDEDTTGGFQHGGWHMRYVDDIFQKWMLENLNEAGGFLFGRRTRLADSQVTSTGAIIATYVSDER